MKKMRGWEGWKERRKERSKKGWIALQYQIFSLHTQSASEWSK